MFNDLVQRTPQFLLANKTPTDSICQLGGSSSELWLYHIGHISQAARGNPTSILTIVINMIMLIMIMYNVYIYYHYHDYDIVKQIIYDNMIYIYILIYDI